MNQTLTETAFYARHFRLPAFTVETQEKLRQSRVLLVGVGGLGCPAAIYLAGAGVGTIGLCDADQVSVSNLHRQTLFDSQAVGLKKVHVAASRLRAVNPFVRINTLDCHVNALSLRGLLQQYDVVVDGTDNFLSKYAIDDACRSAAKPLVYGSIFQFAGQVCVFHLPSPEHPTGLGLKDLYPAAPPAGLAQNCGESGVLGVLPGVIGTLQANETIKIVTGLGTPLSGVLLTFDALECSFDKHILARRKNDSAQSANLEVDRIQDLTFGQLALALASSMPPALIDVRDRDEHEAGSLGGHNIPIKLLPNFIEELRKLSSVALYCHSGARSARAALYLQSVLPQTSVFTLKGGIDQMQAMKLDNIT